MSFHTQCLLIFLLLLLFNNLANAFAVGLEKHNEISKVEFENLEQLISQNYRVLFTGLFGGLFMFGNLRAQVYSGINNNASIIAEWINKEINTLKSFPSIDEAIMLYDKQVVHFPNRDYLPSILTAPSMLLSEVPAWDKSRQRILNNVIDAITRSLNFYTEQMSDIQKIDTVIALLIVKEIDDKHGGKFQKSFPFIQWIENFCKQMDKDPQLKGDYCRSMARQWKSRPGRNINGGYFKSATILQKSLNQTDELTLKNIGREKEEFWGNLVGQCQQSILMRCEIPYICERTLLDPLPRSQYYLTHQLFQRILVENADFPETSPLIKASIVKKETYDELCHKIHLETKYLDVLDVPQIYRDLFAEMVGFCGYMGYTNFLREDWLNRILSWQSKSELGCFYKSAQYPTDVLTTDAGFKRQATRKEMEEGVQPNEKCLPHFTAVSLIALAAHYDYLMESQVN